MVRAKTKIIAGITPSGCLGKNGDLIIHNSEDMKLFRELTMSNIVIMGRKTWSSLPKRPLPNRYNVVITRTPLSERVGVDFLGYEAAIEKYKNTPTWIIGGAEIYEKFMRDDLVDEIHLSIFASDEEGDTYFPMDLLKNYTRKMIVHHKTFKKEIYEKKEVKA